jgi:siderophore synthetase component
MNPDTLTSHALLNCLVREVSSPELQVREQSGRLFITLPRSGRLLRAGLRRPSAGISPRLTGEAELLDGASWQPVGWEFLADLVARELTLATGGANPEFAAQVRDSHAATTANLRARAGGAPPASTGTGQYVASEQALVAGHRFHPAPKARQGDPASWLGYAPEAGARFPLRFLAVRDDVAVAAGDTSALGLLGAPVVPPGYRLLPAHPWQLRLLSERPWLKRALRDRVLLDLGPGGRDVAPTSSVRTVYDPVADVFCKFSLSVRITNCVRTSAWYELAGATELSARLGPAFGDISARFPGTVLLAEPGYRTVAVADREAYEGLAVIAREGLRAHLGDGVTAVVAAALAEPRGLGGPDLFAGRDTDWLTGWWEAYVRAVAPPVLYAFFRHGVVLEPHLQNVMVGVDADGMPRQAIFRDLEGVKLVMPRHAELVADLPAGVVNPLSYDAHRGWNRVAYCLLVNHLAEVAAAVADRCDGQEEKAEAGLWDAARRVLTEFAADHGWPPELRALLAGVPLPGKANLKVRWARAADRDAGYVPVPNPLGPA